MRFLRLQVLHIPEVHRLFPAKEGPPYFKISGLAALPNNILLIGVREIGYDKDNNENPFNYDNLMENLNIPGFYNFVPILLISAIVLVFFKRKHIK